jgi:hypothetical protein
MALFLYYNLPTAIAKARARAIWREMYTAPPLILDGRLIFSPVVWLDADVEQQIRDDFQGFGFLWDDNGELGV